MSYQSRKPITNQWQVWDIQTSVYLWAIILVFALDVHATWRAFTNGEVIAGSILIVFFVGVFSILFRLLFVRNAERAKAYADWIVQQHRRLHVDTSQKE